jgi:signal-transduction protein with cAMP-binding, CBS, and nucleotidyltransferase domain
MRCGNLENEMNIILRGKVYISDAHFNYLCTLTTGDCFGESSMLKGKRRCYNAVAVTNVEIYYLTDHNFQLILERYPAIKNEFEKVLGGGERDYFEHGMDTRIRQVDNMSKDQHKALLNSFIVRSKLIRSSLETKEDLGGVSQNYMKTWLTREFWIGYGTLDDNLPIVYFASARYRFVATQN